MSSTREKLLAARATTGEVEVPSCLDPMLAAERSRQLGPETAL